MRLAFAAALMGLLAAPVLAGSTGAISVGFTVTGNLASPLRGAWQARTAPQGAIYHFIVRDGSGAFHQRLSLPLAQRSGMCDLRVSGIIYSLELSAAGYEMRYGVQSADVVSSSTDPDSCRDIADAWLATAPATPQTLILSRTGTSHLTDPATGIAYTRLH